MNIDTAQKDESCETCGYPFDTHARIYRSDGELPFCSRKCLTRYEDGCEALQAQMDDAFDNQYFSDGGW